MRTAVGAPDPRDWSSQQPHILFNDRRTGESSKNRAVGESHVFPKIVEKDSKQSTKSKQLKGTKKTY